MENVNCGGAPIVASINHDNIFNKKLTQVKRAQKIESMYLQRLCVEQKVGDDVDDSWWWSGGWSWCWLGLKVVRAITEFLVDI